jgi:hypothetical protein
MTAVTKDGEAPHALRLTAVLAAARVAAMQGKAALAAEVAGVIARAAQAAASQRVVVQAFRALAQQGGGAATVLPFAADPLTLDFASLAYPKLERDADLRLYSTSSVTDLGCMVCAFDVAWYADSALGRPAAARPTPRKDKPREAIDLPGLGLPDDWLDALCASKAEPVQVLLAPGAGDTLHFKLTPHEAPRWLAGRSRVRLVLLKAGAAGRVARRELGPVAVKGQGGNGRTLVVSLSGAQQMELHAAFFDGWWMLLGEDGLRALAPVPDLDPQAPPAPCRTDLPLWGLDSLPGGDRWLDVPVELAARLVAQYWWVAPVDAATWLTMLTTPKKGPDEALATEERP